MAFMSLAAVKSGIYVIRNSRIHISTCCFEICRFVTWRSVFMRCAILVSGSVVLSQIFPIIMPMATSKPCVYVIELESGVLKNKKFLEKNPDMKKGKLCVYVGSTGIDPEERFAQHKRGYKANKYVKKFGTCLRLDLVPKYKKLFKNSTESEAAEERHAVRLRKRGYAVWQN